MKALAASNDRPLLVADIGGTNARFGLFSPETGTTRIEKYATADYQCAEDAFAHYLAGAGAAPAAIALAGAGPVRGRSIRLTNAGWHIDAQSLERALGIPVSVFVNDLVAYAAGAKTAPDETFTRIRPARSSATGRTIVLALGTGLGAAWLEATRTGTAVHPSELAHTTIAPYTNEEALLLSRFGGGAVSAEMIASGIGLMKLFSALAQVPLESVPRPLAILARAGQEDAPSETEAARMAVLALAQAARNFAHAIAGADRLIIGGTVGLALVPHFAAMGFADRLSGRPESPIDLDGIGIDALDGDYIALEGLGALALGRVRTAQQEDAA